MAAEAPVETGVPELKYPFPVPEEFQNWDDLPWLCCKSGKDCGACCKALWCPCLTVKDAMEKAGFVEGHPAWGGKSKHLPVFVALTFIFSLLGQTIGGFFMQVMPVTPMNTYIYYAFSLSFWIFKGLFLWTLLWFRSQISKQFNIKFCDGVGCLLDCCCPWYCWCWTLPQELNTIETLTPKEEGIIGAAVSAVKDVAKSLA